MNDKLTLIIGNKNYSSWSLRPWLLMRHHGIAFDEVRLPLDTPEFASGVERWSPSGRVIRPFISLDTHWTALHCPAEAAVHAGG